MIPQMSPYTPELYQPDSYGRYRKYPFFTKTPIPGAGYKVGELVWAEQELNLNGGPPQTYGTYSQVPLRGLGATLRMNVPKAPSVMAKRPARTARAQTSLAPPPHPAGLRRQALPAPRTSPRVKLMEKDMEVIARGTPGQMYSMSSQRGRARTGLRPSGGATIARKPTATLFSEEGGGNYSSSDDEMTLERREDVDTVDLDGLGQIDLTKSVMLDRSAFTAAPMTSTARTTLSPSPSGSNGGGASHSGDEYMGWNVDEEVRRAQEAANQAMAPADAAAEEKPSFFMRKAGPVPYWAIGLGALAVVGGGTLWYVKSR